jgi:hypothetical protein
MTTLHDPEVTAYLRDVRAALADLPPDDRDELLEGLEADLTELHAEEGGALTDRLGSPEAYAAELRSAAGLPAPGAPSRAPRRERLRAVLARIETWPGVAAVRDFLPELRPGWWVLRGYIVAWLLSRIGADTNAGPLPYVEESAVLGLLLLIGCTVGSVWIGRNWHRPRAAVIALNVAVAFLGLVGAFTFTFVSASGAVADGTCCGLNGPNGVVTDIHPYDSQGRPLTDVQLYDQWGNPLEVPGYGPPRVRQDGTSGNNVFPLYPTPDVTMGESAPASVAPILPRPTASPTPFR